MNIINHPLCTASIGAPSDMQDDCSALPVAYHTDEHGTWAVSFWQPDASELATLASAGGVALFVRAPGRQHPVVSMGVYTALSAIPTGISAYRAADGSTRSSYPCTRTALAAALEASKQQAAPDRYQIVPVEATDEMLQAGQDAGKNCAWSYAACYRAMLAAAPDVAQPVPNADELHFNAQRLRNVAKLVGMGSAVPQDDATLDGARGAVLGQIAGKLREQSAPNVDAMANRFLGWQLPKTFGPDCGITFDGRKDDEWNKNKPWPIGTNLLTAVEAKAMFEHCLAGGAQPAARPDFSKFATLQEYKAAAAGMPQPPADEGQQGTLSIERIVKNAIMGNSHPCDDGYLMFLNEDEVTTVAWQVGLAAARGPQLAVPPGDLSDEGIVRVLASFGIDADKSKYDFPELQVSTNIPGIRRVIAAYLSSAQPAAPGEATAVRVAVEEAANIMFQWAGLSDPEQQRKCYKRIMTLATPVPAQQSKPTDLSKLLREYAGNPGYSHGDYADTMRSAADEIDRYYGAMLAWKQTAEKKDRDWREAVTKATDERCAVRAAASAVPAPPAGQSEAARDVLAERLRQISAEDWTPEHDDHHRNDEIAAFAAVYAMPPAARKWPASETGYGLTFGTALCPHDWQPKFGDRRRELVKAGALIVAEIERFDRAATKQEGA